MLRRLYLLAAGTALLGLAGTLCLSGVSAQDAKPADGVKPSASKITSVTVYQNTALVTREVTVPEAAGQTDGSANSPRAIVPKTPLTRCTAVAPTGSSIRIRSSSTTAATTRAPAASPMRIALPTPTNAQGAVMATSPARQPFRVTPRSGFPSSVHAATIDEIATKFDWQAHTVRGALAGALKKRLGLDVASEKDEKRGRIYRIVDEAGPLTQV